ncbi:heme ABC transporter ATP-binding protein [Hymenobacter persicinus]|uniref:Heme ABC transporter ATP-binding protein n=1 Tax=Hymenobacter persicinus TaxID=2025506 RepID=A0A4V1ZB72_9BACT|nr:heme ABC transporter ATP-binding protein [Hymenobacter persicinus]RYU83707.1 heme ABC transporter ATP-binding protein [Hymenobacter persicinus]
MLTADHASFAVPGKTLLHDATLECRPGEVTVLLGPNGAGKTTLLRLLAGLYPPSAGRILLDGQDLRTLASPELARRRAVLSQEIHLAFPLSVEDVVLMGRYPHFQRRPTLLDQQIGRQALADMGMSSFAGRDYSTLSGGEAQKVQMARVLAQIWEAPAAGSRVLLLDEPVSSLDIQYQHQLLRRARQLAREQAVVVTVLHDLNLALTYADRLVLLKDGHIHATLPDPAALTDQLLGEVFGVRMALITNPVTQKPLVIYAESEEEK